MTLRALGEQKFADLDVPVPAGPNWLSELVCDGAEFSHRYYEKLIAHYDIHKGAVRPTEGLDTIARGIVAELLIYAAKGFGHVLDAAITEAGVAAPDVTLTAETFLAATKIPAKFIEKRLTNAEDRKLVGAIYDELKATGRVDKALPEDDRTIRDLHQREVLEPKLAQRSEIRAARIETGAPIDVASPVSRATPTEQAGDNALELAVANRRTSGPTFPRCRRQYRTRHLLPSCTSAAPQPRSYQPVARIATKKRRRQEVSFRQRRSRGGAVDRSENGRAFHGHWDLHGRRLPRT